MELCYSHCYEKQFQQGVFSEEDVAQTVATKMDDVIEEAEKEE